MWPFLVKFFQEGIELGLLLQDVPRQPERVASFFSGSNALPFEGVLVC